MMKNILILIFSICASLAFAEMQNTLNAKDFALYKCLENNYKHHGIEQNDASTLSSQYTPDEWLSIMTFVKDKTEHYYSDTSITHLDNGSNKKMNNIFSQCIGFYHSKELFLFLEEEKLNK